LNSRDVDSLYPFIRTSSIFSENILQLESDGERTDERSVSGLENDIFEGLELELSYFGDSPYSVRYADILTPSANQLGLYTANIYNRPVLQFNNGKVAATASNSRIAKILVSSVPLEAITDLDARVKYAAGVLDFFRSPPRFLPTEVGAVEIGATYFDVEINLTKPLLQPLINGPQIVYFPTSDPTNNNTFSFGTSRFIRVGHFSPTDSMALTPDTEYTVEFYLDNSSSVVESSFKVKTLPLESTPPVISNLQVTEISNRSALISFITDEPASAVITSQDADSLSQSSARFAEKRHLISINDLPSDSDLDFTLEATDTQSNTAQQSFSFTTLPAINEIVIDNSDPGFSVTSGNWTTESSTGNAIGDDYLTGFTNPFLPMGFAEREVMWQVEIPATGSYRIDTWYVEDPRYSYSARYQVDSREGKRQAFIDQRNNGSEWVTLANSVHYNKGDIAKVILDNKTPDGDFVVADAIRFTYLGLEDPGKAPPPGEREDLWLFQ